MGNLETLRVPGGGREGELPPGALVAEYVLGGRHLIGAYAPVAPWGLGAVVDRTVDAALQPVNRIRFATLLWLMVSALIGFVAARIVARRLAGRVAVLATGSHQIAAGNLETRIPEEGSDELTNLAAAFNQMAVALDGARNKITQQTSEIMAWNQTLEKRVEDKTAELRQAQDLLLRSRSLSALGELGAGVAHEINNPLTGALGIVQLLMTDLPAGHPALPLLAGSGARGAAHPQDRAEHVAPGAAAERARHDAGRHRARSRRRDRAVRAERDFGRGRGGGAEVRSHARPSGRAPPSCRKPSSS